MDHLVSIVVAKDCNGVIGRGSNIPWHLRSDLRRFKSLTSGHSVIMGRKTHESILARNGKPLPNRQSIVLTRNRKFQTQGCIVAHSFQEALNLAEDFQVFIIGGAEIYAEALPHAKLAFVTIVLAEVEGDVYFPKLSLERWQILKVCLVEKDEKDEFESTLKIYARAHH